MTELTEINTKEMTNNDRFPFNQIHDTAIIYEGVTIGRGNIIGPFCIIGAPPEWRGLEKVSGKVIIGDNNIITGHATIDSGADAFTIIDDGCYIMKAVHIGHDAHIGHYVTLSCHSIIGGHVIIHDEANVGLGAIIHQKQTIAQGCMIGMGAIVTKKLTTVAYRIYAGNPARLIGDNTRHPNYETYTINQRDTL